MEMYYSPKIIAVRYGCDGIGNDRNRDLTSKGVLQARLAGSKINDLKLGGFDIFTSPKTRTFKTGEIIRNVLSGNESGNLKVLKLLDNSLRGVRGAQKRKNGISRLMEINTPRLPILVTHEAYIKSLIDCLCYNNRTTIPKINHGQVVLFSRTSNNEFGYTFDFL